jgi:hypothetical protein
MATTLKTTVTAQIDAVFKNLLDLGTPTDTFSKKTQIMLTNGTAANTADLMYHDQVTLAASDTADLDLAASLGTPLGTSAVFVEVRAILVSAAAANTNNVNVTRPASTGVPLFLAASDGIAVPPGGVFLWSCPADGKVTVGAGTADLLTFTNSSSGTSVTYDVVIVGTSA